MQLFIYTILLLVLVGRGDVHSAGLSGDGGERRVREEVYVFVSDVVLEREGVSGGAVDREWARRDLCYGHLPSQPSPRVKL